MEIEITYGEVSKRFKDLSTIVIGKNNADFVIPELSDNEVLKLIYTDKYNNYVLINQYRNMNILCNGRNFSKILVTPEFEISINSLKTSITAKITNSEEIPKKNVEIEQHTITKNETPIHTNTTIKQEHVMQTSNNIFDCETEKNRISIIKEIGFKAAEFKQNIKTASNINFILTAAMGILSIISAFAITNYLLGLKIDSSSSTINLTTNFWFLAGAALIILAVCITLKYAVSSLVNFNSATTRAFGTSSVIQKTIIGICLCFLFVIYVLNLSYYKPVSGFSAFFIALLFVGGLGVVTIGSGYFHGQIKILKRHLDGYEYREDFEAVIKNYRILISTYLNKLSTNKINSIKSNLVNNQLKMVLEGMIGIITAPFLAYGVSNTLASCFPEAANWVRISGLRFSPIFLVLATFLIIFAFFSFVRAFTIGKQIKGSEIIKYDGFHDYNRHGVTILGLDSMRSLEREKKIVMFIACSIIIIEFTMNVSYFITEIGGDIQGMFLSIMTAFVPTALLIAETHMLSATMYKIHNLNELLESLD